MDTKDKNKAPAPKVRRKPPQPGDSPRPARRRTAPQQEAPKISQDVVYLAPKPFSRSRMVLRLVTVAAVVLALVLGMSVFFKVEGFLVSGAEKYTAWEICQASGIQEGDNLLLLNRTEAGGKIKAALPYVKTVRVGIKLPGTVHIEIEELDVTYAVRDQNELWWLVSAAGTVVERLGTQDTANHTKILGVHLMDPQVGKTARALENAGQQTDPEGNTLPVVTTGADRLRTVLDILDFLEKEGVVGQAASVDVNNMGDIQIWYEDLFQVKLGNNKDLGTKISRMMATIRAMQENHPYERGVLNITDPGNIYYDSFQ